MYSLLTTKILYTYKLHLSTKNEINLYDKKTCQFCYSIISCAFDRHFESVWLKQYIIFELMVCGPGLITVVL